MLLPSAFRLVERATQRNLDSPLVRGPRGSGVGAAGWVGGVEVVFGTVVVVVGRASGLVG